MKMHNLTMTLKDVKEIVRRSVEDYNSEFAIYADAELMKELLLYTKLELHLEDKDAKESYDENAVYLIAGVSKGSSHDYMLFIEKAYGNSGILKTYEGSSKAYIFTSEIDPKEFLDRVNVEEIILCEII